MRRGSARRVEPAISGGRAASARRGFATGASHSPTSSLALSPAPTTALPSSCRYANTEAMQEFLDRFAATIADDEHVVMVLDQAGWHDSRALSVPANITLVALPPYSPELNPVERAVALPQGALPLAPAA